MRLILARHPKPLIAPGVCYGRLDIPAADAADVAAQAGAIRALAPVRVWSSPSRRCRAVAEATGLPVRLDERLLELNFGAWEGMAWDDVPREALDAWAADPLGFAPPGGESGAALIARVRAVFADVVPHPGIETGPGPLPRPLPHREGSQHRPSPEFGIALVTHGGPLRILTALAARAAPDLLAPAPPVGWVGAFNL